jgi:hypothetical protein
MDLAFGAKHPAYEFYMYASKRYIMIAYSSSLVGSFMLVAQCLSFRMNYV